MFIASFPAGPWQANCYVVATQPGAEAVVVDPGMDALEGITALAAEHRLKPVAALLTHGHLDHMFAVAPLCRSAAASCWVHPDDRALLADPLRAVSPETRLMLQRLGGAQTFVEPEDVRELADGALVEIAGLQFSALHTPGHTPGSTMFRSPYPDPDVDSVVFSGDVLFAGSIGRTDLPGGDHVAMLNSLRTKVLPLPDSAVVLPGHGAQTTIGRERATNPYLRRPPAPARSTSSS